MKMLAALREAEADLRRAGLSFLIAGIRATFSRAKTISLRLPNGGNMSVRPRQSDFETVRQVMRDQEYRLPATAIDRVERKYERICADGMVPVVVDAGANIGAAAIWFKTKFPKAAVVAIEPDPDNVTLARHNLARFQDVTVIEAAIGGEAGFASVIASEKAWTVQTQRSTSGCDVVTVDQAVATVPAGSLFIVKIDIEGFEGDLFEGNLSWLDDVLVVFIEPHDWLMPGEGSSSGFQAAFGERDFEIFVSGENIVYIRRDARGCSWVGAGHSSNGVND